MPPAPFESRAIASSARRSAVDARDEEDEERPTEIREFAKFWAGWECRIRNAPPSRSIQYVETFVDALKKQMSIDVGLIS